MKNIVLLLPILAALSGCGHQQSAGAGESQAQQIQPAEASYSIENVLWNLYIARSDNHNTVFLVTPEGTILGDPLNLAFAEWLKEEIATRFNSEVKYVLYSHHHWDHASGGAAFIDTAEFIGHENMLKGLALPLPLNYVRRDINGDNAIQRSEAFGNLLASFDYLDENGDGSITGIEMNRDIVAPTITFSNDYPVYLNAQEVRMVYVGENHSDDAVILDFVDEATIFGVDWLNVRGLPRTLADNSLDSWIDSVDRALARGTTHIVPGHGQRGRLEDLIAYGNYFRDLRDAALEAVSSGMSQQQFQESISLPTYADWNNYENFLSNNAAEAYLLVQE